MCRNILSRMFGTKYVPVVWCVMPINERMVFLQGPAVEQHTLLIYDPTGAHNIQKVAKVWFQRNKARDVGGDRAGKYLTRVFNLLFDLKSRLRSLVSKIEYSNIVAGRSKWISPILFTKTARAEKPFSSLFGHYIRTRSLVRGSRYLLE